MKNYLSALLAGVFISAGTVTASAQKSDAKSKQILDAVTANYKAKQNNYFKFVYGSGKGRVTKTEPGIFYSEGEKYKLKIMGTEQIFDGNKVYSVNAEDQEVTIAKPNGSEAMFSPLNYLTSYKKDFNVSYAGKKTTNGISTDLIKLTPVKSNGLKNVYLFVNSAKKELVKLEQYGNDNSVSVIAIKGYKANQSLSPSMFSFNKNNYKNYIITEL